MENRLQYFLLKRLCIETYRLCCLFIKRAAFKLLLFSVLLNLANPAYSDAEGLDTEFFELGASFGFINIEDFGSELTFGLSGTFKATENAFLQFNYLQADAALSSFEKSQGRLIESGSRTFQHYDLLLGYNIFQGEVFRNGRDGLSSMYAVLGVGDTEFGGESGFTITYGVGYQLALTRRYTARVDFRHYIYDSSLVDENERSTTNTHLSFGLTWLF